MSIAFAVPIATHACTGMIMQLRDGPRESAWEGLRAVLASANYSLLTPLWESLARQLGLTVTDGAIPQAGAVRESCDPLTNRVAWRL